MTLARTIMVQGTTSSAGKSLLVTALCRWLANAGYRVAPFKAQNMALNSFVTLDGGEIGRAQAVQAEAARVVPCVDMNPILLKPEGESRSQVVVLGKAVGSMGFGAYHQRKPDLRTLVAESLQRLRAQFEVVVIEGAGSPAEINLKDRDIVNMFVAKIAGAPVLLVGDIDRGGVFAAFVGTLELLDLEDRRRIAGFVVNKFRGDVTLLKPGLDFLHRKTGVPVLGVVPFVPNLRIADEDSLSIDDRAGRAAPESGELDVVVVRLPRISNHDDFDPLEHETGVVVRFVDSPLAIAAADLVILPGSKHTVADLEWLRASGIASALEARARRGGRILGICGGCEMLGEWIYDPHGVESDQMRVRGLGLLPLETHFEATKITSQVRATPLAASFLSRESPAGAPVSAYEIHMGRIRIVGGGAALFEVRPESGGASWLDGVADESGTVVGTMLHGLFEDASVRSSLLGVLRSGRGLSTNSPSCIPSHDEEYERLARIVGESVDREKILALLEASTASHGSTFPMR